MMPGFLSNIRNFWRTDGTALLALVFLTAAVYALQILPLIRAKQSIAARVADLQTQQRKASELRTSLQSLKDQLTAAQQLLARSDVQLQPASRLNQQIARLTDLAAENGIQIDSIEPGRSTSTGRYGTVDIRMTGWGTYGNCTTFLKHISGTLRDSSVSKVRLSAQPTAAANSATFSLDLIWYTAPEGLSITR